MLSLDCVTFVLDKMSLDPYIALQTSNEGLSADSIRLTWGTNALRTKESNYSRGLIIENQVVKAM